MSNRARASQPQERALLIVAREAEREEERRGEERRERAGAFDIVLIYPCMGLCLLPYVDAFGCAVISVSTSREDARTVCVCVYVGPARLFPVFVRRRREPTEAPVPIARVRGVGEGWRYTTLYVCEANGG